MYSKMGHYVRNCRDRKKMVKDNIATSNDQKFTPSEEEWDIKASFAITKLEE